MSAFLSELSEDDLVQLLQTPPDVLRDQAEHELATRRRLSGQSFLPGWLKMNIRYEGDRPDGQPGRVMLEGQGRDPLFVRYPGEEDQPRQLHGGMALPPGFPGRGDGVRINFALQPTSNDYSPINWFRFNTALQLADCVYGPVMTPEQFDALPGTPLRSRDRREVLRRYIGE